jgi:hypothetical protein
VRVLHLPLGHLPFPFAIAHFPFAISHSPFAIHHLPLAVFICHFRRPSGWPEWPTGDWYRKWQMENGK